MTKLLRSRALRMLYLLPVLALLLIISCKKNKEETPPTEPEKTATVLTTGIVPGKVVQVKTSFRPATDTLTVFVNGIATVAAANDSNIVAFLMPEVPAGNASLSLTRIGINNPLALTVSNYTPVTQPASVVITFTDKLAQIEAALPAFEGSAVYQMSPNYRGILTNLRQTILTKFNALTASEKTTVAYIMRENLPDPSLYAMDTLDASHYGRTASPTSGVERRIIRVTGKFLSAMLSTYIIADLGHALAMAPGSGVTQLMAAVTFGCAAGTFYTALNYVKELYNILGEIVDFSGFSQSRVLAGELILTTNVQRKVTFNANYRKLIQSDANSTSAFLQSIFTAKRGFDRIYTVAEQIYNLLRSYLPSATPAFPANPVSVSTTSPSRSFAVTASGVTISAISNPAIQVQVAAVNDTTLGMTASSTSITTETPFTFQMRYQNSATGTVRTQTINAIYRVPEPTSASIVSGNNQSAEPSASLPLPLVVKVLDQNGQPLPGAVVTWTMGPASGFVSAGSTVTNSSGNAQTNWTLSSSTGTQTAIANVRKANGSHVTGSPITFSATAVNRIYSMTVLSGDNQVAKFDNTVSQPVVFKLTCSDPTAPIANQTITITSETTRDGVLTTSTLTTNGSGTVSFTGWNLNGKGTGIFRGGGVQNHNLNAKYTSATGQLVTASATATAVCNTLSNSDVTYITATKSAPVACSTCNSGSRPVKYVLSASGGVGPYYVQFNAPCEGAWGNIPAIGTWTTPCLDVMRCASPVTCSSAITNEVMAIWDSRGCSRTINF